MNTKPVSRRKLYPHTEPRQAGRLRVSDIHELYWEDSGPLGGIPVIGLHGGPGGGASPEMRRFFDPRRFRTVLFDQRGCGRSAPYSDLRENTTWDLVADIEKLREHLGIEKWLVFGGSWGSTLALAYAVTHPDRVAGLLLRGVFLLTEREINWFYQHGASNIFPDAYDRYVAPIPEDERGDLLKAFYTRLMSENKPERLAAAQAPGPAGKARPFLSGGPLFVLRASRKPTSSTLSPVSSAITSTIRASSNPTAGCLKQAPSAERHSRRDRSRAL